MITRFTVSHFRAFAESAGLPLAPLTCLVGRNSSGKSSIAHALLILRQSLEQRAIGTRVPQLNLNGALIAAGSFTDIAYKHHADNPVGFTFNVRLTPDTPEFRLRVPDAPLIRLDLPRPALRPGIRYMVGSDSAVKRSARFRDAEISLWFSPQQPFGPTLQQFDVKIPGLGEASFRRTVGKHRVQHWRVYAKDIGANTLNIFFPSWGFMPVIRPRERVRTQGSKEVQEVARTFAVVAGRAVQEIERFLTDLRFLGPFRTPPARRYSFSGIAAADTGISGERAVDLLITERLLHSGTKPLSAETSAWMKRLGLARQVKVRTLAKGSNIFEVSVSGAGPGGKANFADVGFGISQVLPVLVQGYLVPRGGTYVVQQPELHLHPDAQAVLADFFLFLASRGVNSIIETHSEYLLLRLRRRLAERSKRNSPRVEGVDQRVREIRKDDVNVVYLGEQGSSATLEKLEIGSTFQFENLPKGFMSQAVDDRVELLRALRR